MAKSAYRVTGVTRVNTYPGTAEMGARSVAEAG